MVFPKISLEEPMKGLVENIWQAGQMQAKFSEKRCVFLWGSINNSSAKSIVQQLMYLEAEAPGEPISLYINSSAGIGSAGLMIIDVIHMISSPVKTIGVGIVSSMGTVLLAAGEKGQRFVFPHAQIQTQKPDISSVFQSKIANVSNQRKQLNKSKKTIGLLLSQYTGQTEEQIYSDLEQASWFDAEAARTYGLIDGVTDKV